MKKTLEILIPSYNRPTQLQRCIESIKVKQHRDWDVKTTIRIGSHPEVYVDIMNEMFKNSYGDIVVWLADHIVVQDGCIEEIVNFYSDKNPLLDIGMSLFVENHKNFLGMSSMACFTCVSQDIIDHFSNREVMCPDYEHYWGDTELGLFFESNDRFVWNKNARLFTYHPAGGFMDAESYDATHKLGVSSMTRDNSTRETRKQKGLIWGNSFELVNQKRG